MAFKAGNGYGQKTNSLAFSLGVSDMALTQDQLDRRTTAMYSARGHLQTEGLSIHPDDDAVLEAYARGEIAREDVLRHLDDNLKSRLSRAA